MNNQKHFTLLTFLVVTLIFTRNIAGAGKIHITDDLDDVIDDEEDEAWKEWGKKRSEPEEFDPLPDDFSNMAVDQIQAELAKRQSSGSAFGFVKLRLGVKRTQDMVAEIAMKWTKVLRTGAIQVKFMGIDLGTVMFNMNKGQDVTELKEFILSQPDAYEIKIGNEIFRRSGDLPLDEVAEMLRNKINKVDDSNAAEDFKHQKEEL